MFIKEAEMQYLESNKDDLTKDNTNQIQEKPEPFVNWENEGGQVIPTGAFPKVTIPDIHEEETIDKF
jgi:hypothetical protein